MRCVDGQRPHGGRDAVAGLIDSDGVAVSVCADRRGADDLHCPAVSGDACADKRDADDLGGFGDGVVVCHGVILSALSGLLLTLYGYYYNTISRKCQ